MSSQTLQETSTVKFEYQRKNFVAFNFKCFLPHSVEKQKRDIRSRLKDIEISKNLVTLGNVVQEGDEF